MADKGKNVPGDLLYTKEHEWIRVAGDKTGVCGITDHAQHSLGDIVFVEFVSGIENTKVSAGNAVAIVESPKAASDVYSPASGVITAINRGLEASPELINKDPYGEGWFVKIEINDMDGLSSLLKPDEYLKLISGEE